MLKKDLKNKAVTESNNINSIDIRDLEELATAIEIDMAVVDESSTILTTVENQVEILNENIDTMSPMEIGKAIGNIETNLDRVTPNTNTIDCESIVTVKRDLEAISDAIKKAWEVVKKFFRAVWKQLKVYATKIKFYFKAGSVLYIKKTTDILDTIDLTKLKDGVSIDIIREKIGNTYASIMSTGDITHVTRVPNTLDFFNSDIFQGDYKDALTLILHRDASLRVYDVRVKIIQYFDTTIKYALFVNESNNGNSGYVYGGIQTYTCDQKTVNVAMNGLAEDIINPSKVKQVIEYAKSIFNYASSYGYYLDKEIERVDKLLNKDPHQLLFTDIPKPYTNIIWNNSSMSKTYIGKKDNMVAENIMYELEEYSKFLFAELKGLSDTEYYMYKSYDKLLNVIKESYESK